MIKLLDDTTNQPPKFRTIKWVEINGESRVTYSANSDIRFKTSMKRSNLCDYSDAYIYVKGTITVLKRDGEGAAVNNINKKVIFKNSASFTNCIIDLNNAQVDDAQILI